MWIKIAKWFFLSLALSVVPFFLNALTVLIHGKSLAGQYSISHFWEHGELCLISVTLIAAGIGDIASSKMDHWKAAKIVVLCCSVLMLLVAAAAYTEISSCVVLGQPYDTGFARDYTPYFLICSAGTGLACVLLSKEA